MTLILIIGLPNAGKTTYSGRYESVLHLDDFPWRWQPCLKAAATTEASELVVEGIYNFARRRMELLEALKDKPGKRICIWLDTPVEECVRREDRGRPDGIVWMHQRQAQLPTEDEGWDEIIVVQK